MVKAAHQALLTWQASERYLAIGMRAALRTGMAMRIDDACAGVRPTRFPEGYESTIPTASGAPVRSYFNQPPAAPTIAVLEMPRSHEGPVLITSLGASVRIATPLPTPGTSLSVRLEAPPLATSLPAQEEIAVCDGWSDEEERVFQNDEVSASESSEDEDEPGTYRRRTVRRRRWCLPGCDCERAPGSRKCSCERAGDNLCGKHCQCNSELCRSRPAEDEDD